MTDSLGLAKETEQKSVPEMAKDSLNLCRSGREKLAALRQFPLPFLRNKIQGAIKSGDDQIV
ncbi:hypothetical protein [Ralstonia sp. GP101]|uniref:hypothetical protein n=1 Tax=Ralstonia sp. GP101 TaxID=3035146 RepID=UPI003892ADC7